MARALALFLALILGGCLDPALAAKERRFHGHGVHGPTQRYPLDEHNSTASCFYNWVGKTAGPLNPLVASRGGSSCDVPEFASPNWTGGNSTTGLILDTARKDQLEFNNTSGGWGGSSYAGPTITGSILVRALVKTPASCASQTIYRITNTAGGDTLALTTDGSGGCRALCLWDDGPGAASTAIVASLNVSTFYLMDCFVNTSFQAVMCVNGTCSTSGTASGGTGLTPTTAGVLDNNANSQIFTGSAVEIQLHEQATWWNSTVHTADCASIFGVICTL